jgi:hypothetical protein
VEETLTKKGKAMALTDNERDNLLIRIDERQKNMRDKLDEAFSGPPNGFVRHEVYDNDKGIQTWYRRISVSAVVAVCSKIAYDVFK